VSALAKKSVLVTGLSGVIGGAVLKHLREKYDLTALNRREVAGVPCHRADIADLEAITSAFEGKDAVVHLAAVLGDASWDETLRTNLIGTYNVFEASKQARVRRVIFASSGAVQTGYEREYPIDAIVKAQYDKVPPRWSMLTAETPTRPNNLYGASKVWGEALARYYSEAYGISAICLRFGRVTAEDRPIGPRDHAVYCSLRDAAQMVDKCLSAPDSVRFDTFYVVSNNKWRFRDIEHAREVVGYVPLDGAGSFTG
jgi:nucleoside-diphosphate-sugar epimerase